MSDKTEGHSPKTTREGSVRAERARLRSALLFWRIAAGLLLLAVIALGVLLYFSRSEPILPSILPTPEVSEEPVVYTAWCYTPQGEPLTVTAMAGETVELPQAPSIEGYTFIGWADEKGVTAEDGRAALFSDAAFSAVYAVAFRDESGETQREPYLPLDGEGLFHPLGTLSRAEAAELLCSFLDTEFVGTGSFSDVDPSASCYQAAATLKDLGVIDGSRFHPDEPISCEEFFVMLAHFFPKSTSAYSFAEIPESSAAFGAFCLAMDRGWIDDLSLSPDRNLTRAEAAHVFNLLSGRESAETDYAKVGTILDLSFDDPYFWDIAEAAIPHVVEHTAGGELWSSSEALPLRDEGMFFIGTALHCVDSRGSAVVNASCEGFDFGPDGVITTGMPELDVLVQQKLAELVDPSSMDPERMLYIIFNYVTYHHSYLRIHYYEVGDTSWVNDEAYHMFTVGKGNCYCYASMFYVMARAIGFDAVIYSGTIAPDSSPHAWVEIEIDGEPFIYDTELEYTQVVFNNKHSSYYKMPYWKAKGWHYFRGDEIEAAIAAASES